MIYQSLYDQLSQDPAWDQWMAILPDQVKDNLSPSNNGNLPTWIETLSQLPNILADQHNLKAPHITVLATSNHCDDNQLSEQLQRLKPWRKGPYQLFNTTIDTEWRSDWKWDRLIEHISPLNGKTVLDVGCGNGYHSWRMSGEGAKLVIGIDPSLLFIMQFQAIKKYIPEPNVFVLPLKLEDMPSNLATFDSVFSMGVLYHRRSPFAHLFELRNLLKPGGELILETLVISGGADSVLVPKKRYAQMNNVWFLPSPESMLGWLEKCGFKNARVVNVTQTSLEEQRRTPWMEFNSLKDYLDPNDMNLTIEGYPAPTRAIFIANSPK